MNSRDNNFSRREALLTIGSTTAYTLGGSLERSTTTEETEFDTDLPVELKLIPDSNLGVENYEESLEPFRNVVENSFEDLYKRAEIDTNIYVTIDDPVDIPQEEYSLKHLDNIGKIIDEPASHGNLLLYSSSYEDTSGKANAGKITKSGEHYCESSENHSRYSVMDEASYLLEDHFGEVEEILKDGPVSLENLDRSSKLSILNGIVGIHELGHNQCLRHGHGELEEFEYEGDVEVSVSPMMFGYEKKFSGQENLGNKNLPKIEEFIEEHHELMPKAKFSDTAVAEIRNQYKDQH